MCENLLLSNEHVAKWSDHIPSKKVSIQPSWNQSIENVQILA